MSHVKDWLRHAEGARRAVQHPGSGVLEPDVLPAVTRLNARLQLDHLRTHPHVFARVQARELTLHAWVYDIGSGEVEAWDADACTWEPLSRTFGRQPVAANHEVQHA
jgi:carbonic anhydrase